MNPEAIGERLKIARALAEQAGAVLLGHFGRISGYDEKAPNNLVTLADRESEIFIASELRRFFPDDTLCLEEADGKDGAHRRRREIESSDFAWCIDPLDGTTNFVHTYPVFAVSIGLLMRGVPAAGVVHAPARGETFVGGVGIPPTRISMGVESPIHVSRTKTLGESLVATGFPPDRKKPGELDRILTVAKELLCSCHDLRRAGAAALDLCDVAMGRLDAYYEAGLAPWDVAAGHAIVFAAGGRMSRFDGTLHEPYAGECVATNGIIHDEILRAIARGHSQDGFA